MPNFKQDILRVAGDEPIEFIVIGDMGWEDYKNKPLYQKVKGKLLPWKEAIPYIDYEYNTGYGAPDCQAITAWTTNKVIFIWQYDGMTGVTSISRNPVPHMPSYHVAKGILKNSRRR